MDNFIDLFVLFAIVAMALISCGSFVCTPMPPALLAAPAAGQVRYFANMSKLAFANELAQK